LKGLLRALILLLVRLLGAPGAHTAAQSANKTLSDTPHILLLRPDHLGDVLMTTPVLHALKLNAPDAQITMMVGPWSSEVVAHHPDIDRLLTCPFPGFQRAAQKALAPYTLLFSVAKQLRRGHYDLAINLRPDFWWGAALIYLACVPRRVGYALEPGRPFLTHALPFRSPEHATVSNLRLASAALQASGYPLLDEPYTPERYPLQFTPTAEEHQWVTKRLKNEGIDTPYIVGAGLAPALENPALHTPALGNPALHTPALENPAMNTPALENPAVNNRALHTPALENLALHIPALGNPALENRAPIVVIHPGSGAAVKLWRTDGWAACAGALTKSLTISTPVRIILTGSKNERPMLEEIAQGMKSAAVLVTDATIGQLAALLARALIVLSVDSGPLHLAVSQGTPTVQLFGPTDPRIFGPWGIRERHIVLASTHRCPTCPAIPCGRLDFSAQALADHPCVRLITEQQVLAAVEKLLQQSSSIN
jgi:ADP-heptose:LPS heptosyltransferase